MTVRCRRSVGTWGGFVALSLAFACGKYGEEPVANPDPQQGEHLAGDASSSEGSISDGSEPASEDAASDAPSFGETCPPCTGPEVCLAGGCSGTSTTPNRCSKPLDVTSDITISAFVCPEGDTVALLTQCAGGGTFHVVVLRLGSGNWTMMATGARPFIALGACTAINACGGGTSSAQRDITGPATVFVGSTSQLATCTQINVDIRKLP